MRSDSFLSPSRKQGGRELRNPGPCVDDGLFRGSRPDGPHDFAKSSPTLSTAGDRQQATRVRERSAALVRTRCSGHRDSDGTGGGEPPIERI